MNGSYANIKPLEDSIPSRRQRAKRHYGVHPYFTRRPANVVREYILHYTCEGDTVLDPFGGSGVTAIEALLENRTGIHNDINPLANFIASSIAGLTNGGVQPLRIALNQLETTCRNELFAVEEGSDAEAARVLSQYPSPENIELPQSSDVRTFRELFSLKQRAALSILKHHIDELNDSRARAAMLLAWSATLGKLNKTFLSANGRAESRGGSSIFSIYRYKIAAKPVELQAWDTFNERAMNIIAAKEEIDKIIEYKKHSAGWSGSFIAYACDAVEVCEQLSGSIDYIFTDPPYGAHIAYLDLSTMWNTWLGVLPTPQQREQEIIVGGSLGFSDEHYVESLAHSIAACSKALKTGRWMSVVFQHWNPKYFYAILETAREHGMELRAAVSQVGDPIWSMHKKKNNYSVIAGELIFTFFKSAQHTNGRIRQPFDIESAIVRHLHAHEGNPVHGEYIFNRLIVEAWEKSSLDSLHITKDDLRTLIEHQGWMYDVERHYWIQQEVNSNDDNISLFSG